MDKSIPQAEDVVAEASAFIYRLFKQKLPAHLTYHSYRHTVEVADNTRKIAKKEGLEGRAYERVMLAAWFHDAGFVETYDGHEEASARIAAEFMEGRGVPAEDAEAVAGLIRSTHPNHKPETLAEGVLHDADVAHAGKKKKFFRYGIRLREELEREREETYTDLEWTERQLAFLRDVSFYTEYAKGKWGSKKARNMQKLRERLAELLDKPKQIPQAAVDKSTPKRGKETMFRTAYRNHINLSAIADSKANIMISINAILMSIIVSFVSTRLQGDPSLILPASSMLITSLVAVIFAILSARPKVTSETFTLEDVRRDRANILFFGNFVNMPRDMFTTGVREIMEDYDLLYDSMLSDLYGLGQVLQKKYHLLWLSYTVFMGGLIVTVLLFLTLYFFTV